MVSTETEVVEGDALWPCLNPFEYGYGYISMTVLLYSNICEPGCHRMSRTSENHAVPVTEVLFSKRRYVSKIFLEEEGPRRRL